MLKKSKLFTLVFVISLLGESNLWSQDNLELEDPDDFKFLLDDFGSSENSDSDEADTIDPEELLSDDDVDDLESLKMDLGDIEFLLPEEIEEEKKKIEYEEKKLRVKKISNKRGKKSSKQISQKTPPAASTQKMVTEGKTVKGTGVKPVIVNEQQATTNLKIFEVGEIERELLRVAEKMQGIIPNNEWNEIAKNSINSTYTVVKDDWLWKISKRLFGSGFYYSKVWALNPFITNPHLIEPGMVLSFNTGDENNLPDIKVGKLSQEDVAKGVGANANFTTDYGDKKNMLGKGLTGDSIPPWMKEREDLKDAGVYFTFSDENNLDDLRNAEDLVLIKEYENYEPPSPDFEIKLPEDEYDETGFSKDSKFVFDFKEGFYLNTFLTTNIIQDFGYIDSGIDEGALFYKFDQLFVKFDDNLNLVPGDKFSVYVSGGRVSHDNSDRIGNKITTTGNIKLLNKERDLWRCEVTEMAGLIQRGDRITVFTPKISQITYTFNSQRIEATIMGAYQKNKQLLSFGDVVYLDRGRADGVEMGNVFEVYDFKDRRTKKFITGDPIYKTGEVTVISLTDNFATVLISSTVKDFYIGDLAITKDLESAARVAKIKKLTNEGYASQLEKNSLEELDVELNLDNLGDRLLNEADKIQFTEDELAELERQEREKSILDDSERDLRALERLEQEIDTAEKMLREARLDEDKLMENQDLDQIEKELGVKLQDNLDEIEENYGKRYMDEDINDKENPYGLTEFDIEEIDELMNIDQGEIDLNEVDKAELEELEQVLDE